jgi:3-methylcrotonyl-CoA carboxylase alpha subunit
VVSYHFDPLLAKLIVWAPSRRAAIDRMKRALDDFVLLGVRNNIEFLRRVISTDDFGSGKIDTAFLDRHGEVFNVPNEVPVEALLVASHVGAAHDRTDRPGGHRPPLQDVWDSGSWRNS